jgi:hypothetical protein
VFVHFFLFLFSCADRHKMTAAKGKFLARAASFSDDEFWDQMGRSMKSSRENESCGAPTQVKEYDFWDQSTSNSQCLSQAARSECLDVHASTANQRRPSLDLEAWQKRLQAHEGRKIVPGVTDSNNKSCSISRPKQRKHKIKAPVATASPSATYNDCNRDLQRPRQQYQAGTACNMSYQRNYQQQPNQCSHQAYQEYVPIAIPVGSVPVAQPVWADSKQRGASPSIGENIQYTQTQQFDNAIDRPSSYTASSKKPKRKMKLFGTSSNKIRSNVETSSKNNSSNFDIGYTDVEGFAFEAAAEAAFQSARNVHELPKLAGKGFSHFKDAVNLVRDSIRENSLGEKSLDVLGNAASNLKDGGLDLAGNIASNLKEAPTAVGNVVSGGIDLAKNAASNVGSTADTFGMSSDFIGNSLDALGTGAGAVIETGAEIACTGVEIAGSIAQLPFEIVGSVLD